MDINKIIRNRNEAYIASVVLICAICCLGYCNHKSSKRVTELNTLYANVKDTLKTTLNSKGELESKIEVISSEKADAFVKLNINDATIKSLQQQVKYYKNKLVAGSTVSVATTTTHIDTVIVNDVSDLQFDCDTPVYTTTLDDKFNGWITGKVVSCWDSSKVNIDIKNDFSLIVGKEKGKVVAILTDKNPYTKTNNLRVFQVANVKSHWLRNTLIGILVGSAATYTLIK